MEEHHHTSTISIGNEAKKDGWAAVSTGKQSMAEPHHCTSQALVPLSCLLLTGAAGRGSSPTLRYLAPSGSQHGTAQALPQPGLTSMDWEWVGAGVPDWPDLQEVVSHILLLNTLIE